MESNPSFNYVRCSGCRRVARWLYRFNGYQHAFVVTCDCPNDTPLTEICRITGKLIISSGTIEKIN